MTITRRLLTTLIALALLGAACGSSETEPAAVTGETGVGEPTGDRAQPATVVDVAVSSADHTILVQAVTEAGLVETLSGEGPFTVLAPTDAAFAAALDALGLTAEELLASEDLSSILTYHVLPTSALAADVIGLDGQMVETVNGDTVEITVTDEGGVMIDGANVIATDLTADNGVVHVLDAVILPG